MDWQDLIHQFTPLKREDVKLFAPPRDMEQAISTYNRAIFNINHESMDIALIALRKLSATYPMFSQAALLLSYCQAHLGLIDEALEQIDHALLTDLPGNLHEEALASKAQLLTQRELQNSQQNGGSREIFISDPRRLSGANVLEKTKRRGKVRMASAKERQDVIRRSEFPEDEETNVKSRHEPVELLRIAIPAIVGVLVIGLLIYGGFRFLPGLFRANASEGQSDARLAWLTGKLDTLSSQDDAVKQLLLDYHAAFDPTPTPEPSVTKTTAGGEDSTETTASTASLASQTTTSANSATQTTTAPAGDQNVLSLQKADQLYKQAQAISQTDLVSCGNQLLEARELLKNLPDQTVAPDVTGNAKAVRTAVETLISSIGKNAAEKFRVLGMAEFDKQQYQPALDYFLKAYQLYPKAYGGGVAYYCGRCYQELNSKSAAKTYYDFVIENFAGKDIAEKSKTRLKEMGF